MSKNATCLAAAVLLGGAVGLAATGPLEDLACRAADADSAKASPAIAALRAAGPDGLAAFARLYEGLSAESTRERLKPAFDAIAAQRDACASRLYWHTDLEAARAVAKASGKPILQLRLLGRLDEEYSCANSRFFRTALYANAEVSQCLRERFVLLWQTVRPVPRVTIDFGDGRKLERTICGNSIHYVLDAEGRVLDALPGLYGPGAFLRGLEAAERFASRRLTNRTDHAAAVQAYHAGQLAVLNTRWKEDLDKLQGPPPAAAGPSQSAGPPSAAAAAPVAVGKCMVEGPLVRALRAGRELEAKTDDAAWVKLAAFHAADAMLDAGSRALMNTKLAAVPAGLLAATKQDMGVSPLFKVLRSFEASMAVDGVKNEYLLHRKIHEWFAQGQAPAGAEELNEKVYAELFLTPRSDPWLGLVPADTFSALEGDGRSVTRAP